MGRDFLYRLFMSVLLHCPASSYVQRAQPWSGYAQSRHVHPPRLALHLHSPRLETNQRSRMCCPVNRASNDKRMDRLLFEYGMGQGNKRHASCRRRRLSCRAKPITEVWPPPAFRGAAQTGGLRGFRINRAHMILVFVQLHELDQILIL